MCGKGLNQPPETVCEGVAMRQVWMLAVGAVAWLATATPGLAQERTVYREVHILGGTEGLVFSPDGKTLITLGFHGGHRILDLASGKLSRGPYGKGVRCLAFHPGGKVLATGNQDGQV